MYKMYKPSRIDVAKLISSASSMPAPAARIRRDSSVATHESNRRTAE